VTQNDSKENQGISNEYVSQCLQHVSGVPMPANILI
jgi:hypothetical protein